MCYKWTNKCSDGFFYPDNIFNGVAKINTYFFTNFISQFRSLVLLQIRTNKFNLDV